MCATEKVHTLHKVYSGLSYSAIGLKFDVNASVIYINYRVFRQTHIKQGIC